MPLKIPFLNSIENEVAVHDVKVGLGLIPLNIQQLSFILNGCIFCGIITCFCFNILCSVFSDDATKDLPNPSPIPNVRIKAFVKKVFLLTLLGYF